MRIRAVLTALLIFISIVVSIPDDRNEDDALRWLLLTDSEAPVNQPSIPRLSRPPHKKLPSSIKVPPVRQPTLHRITFRSRRGPCCKQKKPREVSTVQATSVNSLNVDCSLSDSVIADYLDEDERIWRIDDDGLEDLENDIQVIIDCTEADDIVLFNVDIAIQPSQTVEIPWPLTISASTLNTENVSGVFPVTGVKATFNCPSNSEGVFRIQTRGVLLANLAFEDCQLDGGVNIIEVENCDDNAMTHAVRLHHLKFEDNVLEDGVGLLMQSPSCSSLEMIDVEFENNVCGGVFCCAVLSIENVLRNIQLEDNTASGNEMPPALFYAPNNSVTVITHLEARDNGATIVFIDAGQLEIEDAVFEDNDAGEENGDACLKLEDAILNMTNCQFLTNTANVGAAIYLTNSTANITDSDFQGNAATWGGALFLQQDSVATITDSSFEENAADRSGGGIYSIRGIVFLNDVSFLNNTAGDRGGGLYMTSSTEAVFGNCNFIQNRAVTGGAASFETQSVGTLLNCIFSNNTSTEDGGGIYASLSNTTFTGGQWVSNKSKRGGSVVCSNATMVVDNIRAIENEGEFGGVLSIQHSGVVTMVNVSMISNRVTNTGGGIFMNAATNLTLTNLYFFNNTAMSNGGGVYAWLNSTVSITNTTFFMNAAVWGGATLFENHTSVRFTDCNFLDNDVENSGGVSYIENSMAILERCTFIDNDANFGGSVYTFNSSVEIRDSRFRNSTASTSGGAIFSRENSTLVVENVTLLENHAVQRGGGIYLNISVAFVSNSNFTRNSVDDSGGGVYGRFVENVEIDNCVFAGNMASFGGAMLFENQTVSVVTDCTFVHNAAEVSGGCAYIEESNLTMTHAPLLNHSAQFGGDIFVFNSRVNLTNVTSRDARGSTKGGSIFAREQGLVVLTDVSISNGRSPLGGGICLEPASLFGRGVTITGCQASMHGGGFFANGSSVICSDCHIKNNSAVEGGGGAFLKSFGHQQLAYQFDDVVFFGNSAESGGGIHFESGRSNVSCLEINSACTYLALVNTAFIDNRAEISGGAILATDPETVRLRCAPGFKDNPIAYYSREDVSFFTVLQEGDGVCNDWTNNTAGSYGAVMGSFGSRVKMMILDARTNEHIEIIGHRYVLADHQSGRPIPPITMELLDAFGHGPIVDGHQPPINATMMSPDRFFCCPAEVQLKNGTAVFKDVTGFRPTGVYRVQIDFSDDQLLGLLLLVVIRGCSIGQVVAANGTFCQECSDSTYNFLPQQEDPGCVPCPDDAMCDNRAVRPNNGHWHQTPCSNHIQECLTERACDQHGRDAVLKSYGDNLTGCSFGVDSIRQYMKDQCREGYDGPLCGSCDANYGRSQSFRCQPCFSGFSNFLLILLSTLVIVGLSGFTIRSNLATLRGDPDRSSVQEGQPPREELHPIPENVRIMEMEVIPGADQYQRQPLSRRTVAPPPDPENPTPMELSKWRAVEIFKITVNYLQVIAVAISLNVDWTDALIAMFETCEFVGGVTSEAATRSVDCLIAEGSSIPRSAFRSAVGLLVPAVVFFIFAVFWVIVMVRFIERYTYLAKRCMLSFMAVAYLSYITITKTVVNVHYCVDVYDAFDFLSDRTTQYWAVDTSLKCYEGSHTVLAVLIGWPVMVLFSLGFPVTVAYVLIRERGKERRSPWLFETAGFLYRAYDVRFIFWESVIMLRKALLAVVVVFSYPLGGNLQGVLSVFVLIFALYFQIVCRPFRHGFEELNEKEGLSLLVSSLTFVAGLFFNDERASDFVRGMLSFFVVACNFSLFVFLVLSFLQVGSIYLRHVLTEEGMTYDPERGTRHVLMVYIRSRFTNIAAAIFRCLIPPHRRGHIRANTY